MARRMSVVPLTEVSIELDNGEELAFQYALYRYSDGTSERLYRFIRKKEGKLKAQRGQAGIPNLQVARLLINEMMTAETDNVVSQGTG